MAKAKTGSKIRTYETVYILSTNISQQERDELHEKFKSFITSQGGEIIHDQNWGVRLLAYKIKKQDHGEYRYLAYTAPYEAVQKMEFNMKITEPVLRFLTVKLDEVPRKDIPAPNVENLG